MSENLTTINLHFDTKENYLTIEEFQTFYKVVSDIIENMNEEICFSKLEYKLVIIPPKEGSFLDTIGILVPVGFVVWTVLISDVGKGFIRGLTGKEPEYHAEDIGKFIKDFVITFLKKEKIDNSEINITKSLEAKNLFYNTCINSNYINGVGFDDTHNFPISRDQFPQYIVKLTEEEKEEEDFCKYHTVIIVSPVIVENSKQQWNAKIKETDLKITFYMEDEKFKNDCLKGKYPFRKSANDDEMVVKVKYSPIKNKDGRLKSVVKVYSFNDQKIESLPNDAVFDQPLIEPKQVSFWEQISLFDQEYNAH